MKSKLSAILLLNYISIATASSAIITPALAHIQHFYHIGHSALGWVVTIFLLGYTLGQLFYGPLSNRFGRLRALRFGLYLNLVGVALCFLAFLFPDYSLLLIGRLITAVGAASGLVCTYILINETFEYSVSKVIIAYSIISFAAGLGMAIFLGGLITDYLGWQYCFIFLFLHGLILLILTKFIKETLPTIKQQRIHIPSISKVYWAALTHPKLMGFSVIVGLYSDFSYSYSVGAPLISQHVLHISPSFYGTLNLINLIGMLGGGIMAAPLIKKYSGMNTMLLGLMLFVLCIVSLAGFELSHSTSVLWFFVTTSATYLAGGIIYSSSSFYASNAIRDKASASAIMNFMNMLSAAVAVFIMGLLPFGHMASMIVIVSAFCFVCIVLRWRLRGHREPEVSYVK